MVSNEQSYNKICQKWDNYRKKFPINKCIIDFVPLIKKQGNVLDIGCGSGYPIAKYLSDQGFIVTGIDISIEMIKKAKSLNLNNATFNNCDFFDFNPTTRYDAVIAFDSFFHFKKEQQKDIYTKLASLMNSGGYLLFTHGKDEGEIINTMFDEEFYYSALNKKTVLELLHNNGFEIINSIENYKEEHGQRDLLVIARKV